MYLPYVYWHYYFGSMMRIPETLRAYDDDIGERPCLVGFINSHCTDVRKTLWAKIVAKINDPSKLLGEGHCAGNGVRTGEFAAPFALTPCVPDCRQVMRMRCWVRLGACGLTDHCAAPAGLVQAAASWTRFASAVLRWQ